MKIGLIGCSNTALKNFIPLMAVSDFTKLGFIASRSSTKAQDWAKRNERFGQDVAMTSSAFAFHRQLVEDERIDPTTDQYCYKVSYLQRNEETEILEESSLTALKCASPSEVVLGCTFESACENVSR